MIAARCVWPAANLLGEGPVWNEAEQAIYWVDIEQPRVLRFTPSSEQFAEFVMPEKIGCIAFRQRGGLVAGMQSGFCLLDLPSKTITPLNDPEADRPDNRFNDGKCDALGNFWAGTMHMPQSQACGALYRLGSDGQVQVMDQGYGITNGPAWSPDGTKLYHNDSAKRTVYVFDCDAATGELRNKRVFVQLTEVDGFPDGLTVDREGCIWLAHWGGSRVTRFHPNASIERVVPLPVSQVTSCTFGGADLRTLFITSARIGLKQHELEQQPLAGHLFAVDCDVAGMPANRFAG